MHRQGMNLVTAYVIGTVVGLSITLGVVARVADRVGAAENGVRALVCAPVAGGVRMLRAGEAGAPRTGG
jgi:hypothetical protein